jgi:hypothetical protein
LPRRNEGKNGKCLNFVPIILSMQLLQQAVFLVAALIAIWLFTKKVKEIRRNIFLGQAEDLSGDSKLRWRNLLLLALGQKKMFKNPLVAILHLVVYAGFIIINIEVLETPSFCRFPGRPIYISYQLF